MTCRAAAAAWLVLAIMCAGVHAQAQSSAPVDEGRPILRPGDDVTAPAGGKAGANTNAQNSPTVRNPTNGMDSGWVMTALGGVVALILVMRWGGQKLMGKAGKFRGGGQVVKVLGRYFLAPRQQVLLLQVGRRIVVVGDSGGQLQSLAQITEADEVAALLGEISSKTAPIVVGNPFASLFGRAKEAFDPSEGSESDVAAPSPAHADVPPVAPDEGVEATRDVIRDLTERVRGIRDQISRR